LGLRDCFASRFCSCLIHQAQLPNKLGNYLKIKGQNEKARESQKSKIKGQNEEDFYLL